LEQAYRGIGSADVLATRSILLLFSWNSLKDVEPLQRQLNADLDDATLAALGRAARDHRSIWVGATNADTGIFTRFDLTGIALYQPVTVARKAIVDRIMAATAIPVFFPPRFIEGCMYVDGGVRANLFLAEIGDAIHSALGGVREFDNATINIYAVLNGPLAAPARATPNTLLDVGERAFELAANQIQLASLRETYDFAALNHYNFYWTSPDDLVSATKEPGKCGPPPAAADEFGSDFTACLFNAGRDKAATAANPWRNDRP
jgi:predicted acylesterase/phospholipase RssA